MAAQMRHAAWQQRRSYAVEVLAGAGPATVLANGLAELHDALDFVFEWLDRRDPARDGAARLAILETREGVSVEVWTYPPAQADGHGLVELFGYDPSTWTSGIREFSAAERRIRLRERLESATSRPDDWKRPDDRTHRLEEEPTTVPLRTEHAAASAIARNAKAPGAEPAPPREPEPVIPPAAAVARSTGREPALTIARSWAKLIARGAWDDLFARSCVITSASALWLTLALTDPRFLLALLISLPALCWRQHARAQAMANDDVIDF